MIFFLFYVTISSNITTMWSVTQSRFSMTFYYLFLHHPCFLILKNRSYWVSLHNVRCVRAKSGQMLCLHMKKSGRHQTDALKLFYKRPYPIHERNNLIFSNLLKASSPDTTTLLIKLQHELGRCYNLCFECFPKLVYKNLGPQRGTIGRWWNVLSDGIYQVAFSNWNREV